jgi:hypothetical protein
VPDCGFWRKVRKTKIEAYFELGLLEVREETVGEDFSGGESANKKGGGRNPASWPKLENAN